MTKVGGSLSKTDTKKYVNFNILKEGQNVNAQDILPSTEIDLGTLDLLKNSISTYGDAPVNRQYISSNIKYYEINANFGKNWDSGDKNFIYQIEIVYSQADEYIETALTLSSFQSEVTSLNGIFIESYDHANIDEEYNFDYDTSNNIYFNLSFNVNNFNKSVFSEDLKNVSVSINNQDLDHIHL